MEPADFTFFVGIDWATEAHTVCVVDASGRVLDEREVKHSGDGLLAFLEHLEKLTDHHPDQVAVAIETPHGAPVEMLCDRGVATFHLNPKQLDRFRDRHTVAGAKDDRRDAYVLADALRTDLHLFRRVRTDDPHIVELRELARLADELQQEHRRLSSRLREQVYRYFPQMLELCPAADEVWFWELLERVPTPEHARRTTRAQVGGVLRRNRVRRYTAADILATLRKTPVRVGPGTEAAARTRIRSLLPRLRLVHSQHHQSLEQMKTLLAQLAGPEDSEGQKNEHRDAAILLSMPGIGIKVAATMLGEAGQAIADRDYDALRKLAGQAPVTRRSGKRMIVLRRYACNPRLQQALYHAARIHVQHDPAARALYAAHRARGQEHGRALRSVGDRLLRVLVALLRAGLLYQKDYRRPRTPADRPAVETEMDAQEEIAA